MSAPDDLFTLDPAANGLGSPSCSAVLSSCGQYRYELWRRWAEGPHVLFIMLNPSTADATNDDATIRKCVAYAKRWGFGALCVGNLFAFRATDPKDMKAAADPIGPENNATLARLASEAGVIVAAWGAHGTHMSRDKAVMKMLPTINALHVTKDGSPGHPLYLKGDATPFPLNVNVDLPDTAAQDSAPKSNNAAVSG